MNRIVLALCATLFLVMAGSASSQCLTNEEFEQKKTDSLELFLMNKIEARKLSENLIFLLKNLCSRYIQEPKPQTDKED